MEESPYMARLEELTYELNKIEKNFQLVLDNIPDFVLLVDRGMHFTYINRTVGGLSRSDVIGRHFNDFNLPQYHERAVAAMQHAFETGEMGEIETEAISATDQPRWYQTKLVPIRENGIEAVLMISRDITEHKRMVDELARRNNILSAKLRIEAEEPLDDEVV